MASSSLRLKNMVFYGRHGVLSEERTLGQKFEVDVEMALDFIEVAALDDPKKVIDYRNVFKIVETIVTKRKFKLMEALAARIADMLIDRFPVRELIVRVRKPHPPIRGHIGSVEVEVRRGKAS